MHRYVLGLAALPLLTACIVVDPASGQGVGTIFPQIVIMNPESTPQQPNTPQVIVVAPDSPTAQRIASPAALLRTANGQCVDVAGTDHRTLIRYNCHGRSNQIFQFMPNMEIRQGQKCMDIAGNDRREGAPVIMYPCNGQTNQKWFRNGYQIRSALHNKCLDARDKELRVRECQGQPSQHFGLDTRRALP